MFRFINNVDELVSILGTHVYKRRVRVIQLTGPSYQKPLEGNMTTGARNQHWKAVFTNNRRIGVLLLASILTLSQLFAASPTSDSRIVESLHRLPLVSRKTKARPARPSISWRGAPVTACFYRRVMRG